MCQTRALYLTFAPDLHRFLRRSFADLCESRIEDAVADTYVVALSDPQLIARAWESGGEAQARGLLRTIGWRCARAQRCRGAMAFERPDADLLAETPGEDGGQEAQAELSLHLGAALKDAADRVCPSASPRLVDALIDRFLSGDPDTVVARRHEVPREYITRARRHLMEHFQA